MRPEKNIRYFVKFRTITNKSNTSKQHLHGIYCTLHMHEDDKHMVFDNEFDCNKNYF